MTGRSDSHNPRSRRDFLVLSLSPLLAAGLSAQQTGRQTPGKSSAFDWDSVKGVEIYSESVYLDLISDDGRRGFIARIGRYPTLERCWLWAHVFDERGVLAFTSVDLPDSSQVSDLEAPEIRYVAPQPSVTGVRFELLRQGLLGRPASFGTRLEFSGQRFDAGRAAHPQHHSGGPTPSGTRVLIEAELEPRHEPATSLSGRSEVLGSGRVSWTVNGTEHDFSARGHFHEQIQSRPRFVNPFVYATLRGDGFYSVAILTERGTVGFAAVDGRMWRVEKMEIAGPTGDTAADARSYLLHLVAGSESKTLAGQLFERHVYSVPIYDGRRRGTVVAGQIEERSVSGCVNDHLPEALPYS